MHQVSRSPLFSRYGHLTSRNASGQEGFCPTIPRVSRLLALAHHVQQKLDTGEVESLADVARELGITRPRLTQIMSLLLLAPGIQEEVPSLPRAEGRDPLTERALRRIVAEPLFDWQREFRAQTARGTCCHGSG